MEAARAQMGRVDEGVAGKVRSSAASLAQGTVIKASGGTGVMDSLGNSTDAPAAYQALLDVLGARDGMAEDD